MQPEALFGAAVSAIFLGSAYSFFSTSSGLGEGRARDLMFLEGLFSLSVSIFAVFFLALNQGFYPILFFGLSFLSLFAVWSVVAYLILAFSRSFGFKNTPYMKRLALERNVSEFFGACGYAPKVSARHLLDARLITPSGALSDGITLERMEAEGHVCRLPDPYAARAKRPASGRPRAKRPASGKRRARRA